ncbi:helix-turn-helix domain-containing protein [Actinoplanes sp. CA-252034]|uniref:helix-turn-helix domain-containing protein n=1 Tax=Actinoplanes sp. CA-252034 TaxID=3239906 RepID=UPI003D985180
MNARIYDFTPRTSPTTPADAETPAPVGRVVYTVKEVAGMLSLNLGGTYALIRSGEIPAIKLGGRWVVPRGRFHTWLEACHAEPESVSPVGLAPIEQAHAEVLAAITRRRSRRGA